MLNSIGHLNKGEGWDPIGLYKKDAAGSALLSQKSLLSLSSVITSSALDIMAPPKAISAAFVAFLCLCSQAVATKEFDYYSLVLMVIFPFLPTL